MTLEERLNEEIEVKEETIEKLKEEIEQLKRNADLESIRWQKHQYFKESELQKSLPVPRLEMRLKKAGDWYNIEWLYGIVYKHYRDTENETMMFVPISLTTSRGGDGTFDSHYRDGKLDTPFRDGIHIAADRDNLNLPAFIICEEKNIAQEISLQPNKDTLSKMKRNPYCC